MTDTLTRNIYNRLFSGTHDDISDTTQGQLLGALFDKTYMPALVLEPGKQVYYNFDLAQAETFNVPLPENYTTGAKLYIAVRSNLKARVTFTSPTHGSTRIVLLNATDDTTQGVHGAFWTYQGDMTTFAVSIPSTAQGGATTSVQIFMYEIPDLDDYESYYDKQIGLGTTGEE